MDQLKTAKKTLFGIFGTGGFGREVMPIADESVQRFVAELPELNYELVFVETKPSKSNLNGCDVLSEDDFLNHPADIKLFTIAVGNSTGREQVHNRLVAGGATPFQAMSNLTSVSKHAKIGPGAVICANSMVLPNATIGTSFQSNFYSYVAHDCEIGDFVTFAPRVSCNGRVRIGNHAYIGTGAVLREGVPGKYLEIGEGAVVGMGAIVTKDVAPFTTVVGNPAKPMIKK